MCLDRLWTISRVGEWLKEQPKNITAYKVVKISEGEAYPPVFNENHGVYKKINKADGRERLSEDVEIIDKIESLLHKHQQRPYKTYYHLFLTKIGAERWKSTPKEEVLWCRVPKDKITDVGTQNGYVSIITKEFTFVGGDKYFNETLNKEE